MALVQELPTSVETTLKSQRNGHGDEPLTVAVKADITSGGNLGERWVIADRDAVRVFSPNGGETAHLDLTLPLSEITGARTENLVGGGALIASRGNDSVELARYTTPLAGKMAGAARLIEALAKNEELPELAIDEEERVCPTCGRPLPKDTDVCRFCINKSATLARLFAYATPHKARAFFMVFLMLAGTAVGLAPGKIIQVLTDRVFVPKPPAPLDAGTRFSMLGWLVVAMIGTHVLGTIISIIRGRLSSFLSGSITLKLRTDVYQKLQELGMSYYDKRQTGALMTRVTQDVNELNNFLVDGLQVLVVNGLTLVGILFILLTQNWRLTLFVLIPVPLVVIATRMIWKFLWQRLHKLWHLRSAMNSALNSTLTGARVVKAFAQEDREIDRFNNRAHRLYQTGLTVEYSWATVFPILNLIMLSGQFVVYYVGGRQVVGEAISIGTLNMFLFYLGQLYGPLQGMTRIADWLSRALTAAERVFEVLDTEPDVKDEAESVAMPHINGSVTFENVSFGYDKARRVLENVSLDVKPGEMIGLVGHSGAGKTTIINLLSRFYDPTEGRIFIDGVEMKRIKVNDLRGQIGVVLQEPFLFPGTIAENIAYAKADATPEEIMRAAKAANAHEFIMRFADGYDTSVGERGTKLSGGERQRISIARAILHNPRILILDEATASVDTETEKQIQEAIGRLIKGRTTFAIAHRLSTLRNADRLVVIDKGKVAETGTHDELMEKEGGIFRRLVDMQTEINKLREHSVIAAE